MSSADQEWWYRVVDGRYAAPLDEWERPLGSGRAFVTLISLRVIKTTPKGVRLEDGRFVLRDARKRYACPTETEAWESWFARKQRQLTILEAQVDQVYEVLGLAQLSQYNEIDRR